MSDIPNQLLAHLQATLDKMPGYAWYASPAGGLTFVNSRSGGTLFLDEVGELSMDIQVALPGTIAAFDGYVFVTPEYNHGPSAALKNAIDFLHQEWANKAAGFIGYGASLGARAVEHLRLVMASLQVATVTAQVGLSLFTDFENFSVFKPAPAQEQYVNRMLDQVIAWSGALGALRNQHV